MKAEKAACHWRNKFVGPGQFPKPSHHLLAVVANVPLLFQKINRIRLRRNRNGGADIQPVNKFQIEASKLVNKKTIVLQSRRFLSKRTSDDDTAYGHVFSLFTENCKMEISAAATNRIVSQPLDVQSTTRMHYSSHKNRSPKCLVSQRSVLTKSVLTNIIFNKLHF